MDALADWLTSSRARLLGVGVGSVLLALVLGPLGAIFTAMFLILVALSGRTASILTRSVAHTLFGGVLLALATLLLGPFGFWMVGAVVVLMALRGGPAPDLLVALIGGIAVAGWVITLGAGPVPAALTGAAVVVPALLAGRLLKRGGSLNVAFQMTALGVLALLAIVHLVLADPPGFWRPAIERVAAEIDSVGAVISTQGLGMQTEEVVARSAERMWSVVGWLLLLNAMLAIFVALYWSGCVERVARLGPAFRQLSAGRTLAAVGAGTVLATALLHSELAADASLVLGGVFALQALAVLHAAREAFGAGGGWLAAVYVLLFFPLTTPLVSSVLVAVGFVDNWFPLRPRFAAAGRGPGG